MADEPKTLNFTVREYIGTEVYKFNAADHEKNLDHSKLVSLTREDELAVGDQILVAALMGGYYLMKVDRSENGDLFAEADKLLAVLEFAKDDRKAWICGGLINKRGLTKLTLESKP